MCDARRVTSEPTGPAESGAPDTAALAKIVARQRAEMDRLRDQAATSAVVDRAKGAVMALTGCSPDAAGEELLQRAKAAHRTLLEECWITLGGLVPPAPPAASADAPEQDAVVHALRDTEDTHDLGRLGRALVRVGTPQDLARCLLEHLTSSTESEAVMIFARLPAGGLELVGHAGIDETLAAQWRQVPPLSGIAALDALRDGQPRWLEEIETDRERYLLIGDPPERWLSRAWIPVVTKDRADVCIGVLRARGGPFTPAVREHLLAVARLCAGRLRAFDPRREPSTDAAVDAVQTVFDALPGSTMLLSPLRTPSGEVEDYRIEAATEGAFDALGRTGRDLLGLRLLECFPTLAGEPLWEGCRHTLATGEVYDGEPFAQQAVVEGVAELTTYTVRIAALGGGLAVSWLRHDSSDRQEQRLADVQRLGNLGWANWNLITHDVSWSSQVYTVLDRDPAAGPVRLTGLRDLAVPEDAPALTRAVGELMGRGRPCAMPFRIRAADGIRHLRIVAETVLDGHGTPVEVHGFLQDLTALRSAELALVESEQAIVTQHDVLRAERTLAARLQHALLPCPPGPCSRPGSRSKSPICPRSPGSRSAATGSAPSNCPTATPCSWSVTSPDTASTPSPTWPNSASPPRAWSSRARR